MDFERYAKRISSLNDIYDRSKGVYKNEHKIRRQSFQVQKAEMKMTSVLKLYFSSLNDKILFF